MDPAVLEAVKRDDLPLLRNLIAQNAIDIAAVNHFNCTYMHYAAYYASAEMIKQLAVWEPRIVDAVNDALITPLHLAAECGRLAQTKALLVCGSTGRRQLDVYDYTPLDCARRFKHKEVELVLANNAL